MNFGNNLKMFRKNKKMSQEDLADKIGVTRQSVSKWENGEAYPEMSNIIFLCKIFHCEITDLISDNLIDNEKWDDVTKKEIILFKKNQQKRMKYISKSIYIISRIANIIMILPIILLFILSISFPFFSNSLDLEKNELDIFGIKTNIVIEKNIINIDNITIEESGIDFKNFFVQDNKNNVIIWLELKIIFSLLIAIILFSIFYSIYKLYKNINIDNTPFNLTNEKLLNKTAILFIIYMFSNKLFGLILKILTKNDFAIDFGILDIIIILIVISVIYLFKYGRMIQADSNYKIYE